MGIYTENIPYNPSKKVAYKESFGIILELVGLNRIVRYKYLIEGDYMETFGIINSYAARIIGWGSNFRVIGVAIRVSEFLSSHEKIEKP
ncbi:hypothetical protein CK510_07480 [Brunnivagina elsteri CCALA 953]|uniref:Uncharacterized protein n=1 Tax=Brunnivagina elsteri CCALA 953 TaxID=987040 RepID=A0A2A2TLN0_9CYAN|nr:hypothetical protein CK510_07480 [Calothrix elsteri CCALA 953]